MDRPDLLRHAALLAISDQKVAALGDLSAELERFTAEAEILYDELLDAGYDRAEAIAVIVALAVESALGGDIQSE